MIADTGIHGNTREAIQKVEAKGQEVLSHFHEIGQLTQQVEAALKEKDLIGLGQALTACHDPVSYTHLDVYKRQPLLVLE